MAVAIKAIGTVGRLTESLFSDAPVIKRSVGMPKYRTGNDYRNMAVDYTAIEKGLYSLGLRKGVRRARRHPGKIRIRKKDGGYVEFLAYRNGDEIVVSDEICRYEIPDGEAGLRALAFYSANDSELASHYLHEINEEVEPSNVGSKEEDDSIHHRIQVNAVNDALRLGYTEAVKEALKLGEKFHWAQISYDELDERVFGGPSYLLYQRPTGQLSYERLTGVNGEIQPVVGGRGIVIQHFANVERAGLNEWLKPESDPVDGALSFLGTEMKATGYYISPISQLRPPGIVFTLGPRGPSHREKQLMQGMQEARESAYKRGYEAGKAAA